MVKLRLNTSRPLKSLFMNKFFDLLIVIIGVTIAFQLNNIKHESDEQSLERFYLGNLAVEIDKDIKSINHILNELQSDSLWTNLCLSKQSFNVLSLDTLSRAVDGILTFNTFSYRNDNTYSTLMSSHGLSIIKDKEVRNLITDYYKCYKSIDRFEYVYTEFLLNDFHKYFFGGIIRRR